MSIHNDYGFVCMKLSLFQVHWFLIHFYNCHKGNSIPPPCISTVKDSILVRSHANRMLSDALISFLTLFAYSRAFEAQNDLSCLPGVKAQVSDTSTICEDRQSYPISVYGIVNEPHVHWDQLRLATSSSDLCILGYSSDLDSHFNLDYIIWTTWIHSGNQKVND